MDEGGDGRQLVLIYEVGEGEGWSQGGTWVLELKG